MDLELILRWAAMLIEAVQQRRQVNSNRILSARSFGYFFIEAIRPSLRLLFYEAIRSVSKACYLEPIFYKYEYKPLIIYMFVSAASTL